MSPRSGPKEKLGNFSEGRKTIKAGVIGYPIAHSLSPLIHQHWLKECGIDGTYEKIEVKPYELKVKLKELADKGYAGVNVTIPHKEKVLEVVDELTPVADYMKAVNTITFRDGKIYGDNTDGEGFIYQLSCLRSGNEKKESAIVLGAGGAARAVVTALLSEDYKKIIITNRTISRAENIARDFGNDLSNRIQALPWEEIEKLLPSTNLLVNTTSLGMTGQPELAIDISNINKHSLVTDIVYNPLMTGLLKQAESLNIPHSGGFVMLVGQARPGFARWFNSGKKPEVTPELYEELVNELSKR